MPLNIGAIAYTHYESDPRVRREAEALAARGDRVVVWTLRGEGQPQTSTLNGVEVHRIRMPRYRGARALTYVGSYLRFMAAVSLQLVQAHAREKLDIVHVHTMPDFMVFAGLLPKLTGAKVALDMHDLMPDLYALKFGMGRTHPVVRALQLTQQSATGFADVVLCVHENQYGLLLEDGVPARKLIIVMNAADPELFPPRKKQPRIKENGPIEMVYHGTILHRYGIDLAIRAFAKAHAQLPQLRFKILGAGDYLEEARALAASLGLSAPNFEMPGVHRPLEEVAQAIRGAHIGVVPNRDDHEDSVLPTKLLEYIAIGIPSIASKTRCISRFFDDSQVQLVPVGDVEGMAKAMVDLAQDAARRKAMVAAGRKWEEAYGWEVNKKALFRTFDSLCLEKVLAEKRARQKSKEGVKTGTRKTPPKKANPPKSPKTADPQPPA